MPPARIETMGVSTISDGRRIRAEACRRESHGRREQSQTRTANGGPCARVFGQRCGPRAVLTPSPDLIRRHVCLPSHSPRWDQMRWSAGAPSAYKSGAFSAPGLSLDRREAGKEPELDTGQEIFRASLNSVPRKKVGLHGLDQNNPRLRRWYERRV